MLSTSKKILMFLFLFILTSPFFSQAATEQRVALVIGNSAYKTGPLRNPINDAVAMSDTLKKLGFNVTLIKNAQHQDMDEAIRDFGNQLKRTRGVGLFYYAGHGMQIGGVNYLLPVNARIEKESDVRFHSINTDMLIAEMVNAENGMNIIILDACRDNPFYSYFRNTSRGLAIINNAPSGMFISYSTGANQVARDGEGANSPYTKALLEYIDEPGMTINDVFMKVRRKLKKETGQVPWEMSSLERKFYFVVGEDEEQRRLKEEKALAERKKVLDEQQQKIEKEKAALEAKKSMTLDEEQRRLKEEKAWAEKKKILDEQQQKIEKEKAALEAKKSMTLDEEQRRLKEEKALAERKKVLDEQQQKIEKEKAALEAKKSMTLDEGQHRLKEEKALAERKKVLDEQQQKIEKEKAALEAKKSMTLDEGQHRLKEEKALAERKKILDEQQQKIEKEKAALEAKKSMTLDEEQRRLKEEKALAERKKVLDEQQQKIEKEKAALEQKRSLALATERKLVVVNAVSQKVENRIQFTYDLLGNETEAEVDLIVTVNEKLYKSSDLHLKGDFGTVKMGKHKIVWWDIQKDFPNGVDASLTWKIEAGRKTFISPTLKAKFVLVPSGTFTMGVGLDDETMHQVTISQPFYLQTTPVTQAQWKLIMGNNPSKFKNCGDACPVERVSWKEAQEFITKLNTLEKTDKYYLPTEAQWEYAARSGGRNETIAGMPSEIDRGTFGNYSWHKENSGGKIHPVGQKLPNGLGLYDMSGNIWEWCQDWYAPYSTGHVTDPVCELPDPGRIINWRILRGGSWYNDFYYCTTTRRYSSRPGGYSSDIGFRLARKH